MKKSIRRIKLISIQKNEEAFENLLADISIILYKKERLLQGGSRISGPPAGSIKYSQGTHYQYRDKKGTFNDVFLEITGKRSGRRG